MQHLDAATSIAQPGECCCGSSAHWASVITVGYKDGPQLCTFVKRLDVPANVGLELVVAQNAWRPHNQALPTARHICVREQRNHQNLGFARAFNSALSCATGEVIVSCNSDILPLQEEGIRQLVTTAITHQAQCEPVLVAPSLITGGKRILGRRFYSLPSLFLARSRFRRKLVEAQTVEEVDWVLGACFAVRADALEQLGGLDERYFLYFEDVDLCWRIWNSGGKIIVRSDLQVEHTHHRASRRLLSPALYWHTLSAMRFFLKHPRSIVSRRRPNA